MMVSPADFSGATFCLVTGASQGIGRTLAIEFSKVMGPGSFLVLLARNYAGLEETKQLAESSNVEVLTRAVDLSSATDKELQEILQSSLAGRNVRDFQLNMIVHNAGSIGDLTIDTSLLSDSQEWQKYYTLNVFNTAILNSHFLKLVQGFEENTVILNITSLCAIKPMGGLAYYCSGKAAREMYFKVLAEEIPSLRVLNYAPGPVQTSMIDVVIDTTVNDNLKSVFQSFKSENILLTTNQTTAKCLKVLQDANYKSGDHVDYFD